MTHEISALLGWRDFRGGAYSVPKSCSKSLEVPRKMSKVSFSCSRSTLHVALKKKYFLLSRWFWDLGFGTFLIGVLALHIFLKSCLSHPNLLTSNFFSPRIQASYGAKQGWDTLNGWMGKDGQNI